MKQNESKYKGGVLIIGSLFWENSELRRKWRDQQLDIENIIRVKLPIRYGRKSESRNYTYTMIFSTDCRSKDKLGEGIFIPFKKELTIEQIINQGKPMIEAEHNRTVDFERFNWGWGSLGVVINTDYQEFDIEKSWKEMFGNGFKPSEYKKVMKNLQF